MCTTYGIVDIFIYDFVRILWSLANFCPLLFLPGTFPYIRVSLSLSSWWKKQVAVYILGQNLQAVTLGEEDRWQTKSVLNKATSKTTQVTRFGLVDMSSPLLHIFLIQHISPVHTLVWMLALPGLLVGPTKVLLRTGPSSYIVSHHHYYQHFIV